MRVLPVPRADRPRRHAALGPGALALAMALPSAASASPPSFLREPTDQLGVPGHVEGAELTATNSLFTGRLELTARDASGRPWVRAHRTLAPSGVPEYHARERRDGLDRGLIAFAADEGGVPTVHLRLTARNATGRARPVELRLEVGWLGAGLRVRPSPTGTPTARGRFPRPVVPDAPGLLDQPGDPFRAGARYAWRRLVLARDGSPLLAVRARGADARAAAGVVTRPDAVGGRLRLRTDVPAGGRRTVDVSVPLRATPPGHRALTADFDAARRRHDAAWRATLRPAMSLRTPEPAVDRAWRAGLLAMLVPRHRDPSGRWIQAVNKFQYQASWVRDTVVVARALDVVGLGRLASEDLAFLPRWQEPDGLIRSRTGQLDGMGQALWAYGEHAARGAAPAALTPLLGSADAAMGWVAERLTADPRWILPPSDPGDNELVQGHAAGDLAWLAGGTRSVVRLAQALGDQERAARWSRLADRVAAVARARLTEAAGAGPVPPVLDAPGGRRWGEMFLAWPTGLFAPTDPIVRRTMDAAARDEREGLALWGGRLHLYLGMRRLQTELRAGRPQAAVAGLYAVLAHLTSTGGTWEQSALPHGTRGTGDALGPHAWAAAELVSLLRDMLVREDGAGVRLLDAIPPAWLRPGAATRVRGARTTAGAVDLTLRARADGATLRWAATGADVPLVLRIPDAVRDVRAPGLARGARELVLPGRRGVLRLRWRPTAAVLRGSDAASTQAALRRAYARHGRGW